MILPQTLDSRNFFIFTSKSVNLFYKHDIGRGTVVTTREYYGFR